MFNYKYGCQYMTEHYILFCFTVVTRDISDLDVFGKCPW